MCQGRLHDMTTDHRNQIKNRLVELIADGRKLEQQIEELLNKDERGQGSDSQEEQSE